MRFLLVTLLLFSQIATAAVTEINSIAAVVDDEIITRQELNDRVEQTISQLRQSGARKLPSMLIIERQVLERVIIETIQLERAKLRGIRISEEKLNEVIADIAAKNKVSLFEFRKALEKEGLDYNQFRKQIANEYLISRLKVKEVDETINVTPKEIDEFLLTSANNDADTEYKLSHILITIPEAATPDVVDKAKQKAMEVYQKIRSGADFKEMAISFSDGQQALKGGDLGWRKTNFLPTLFLDVVKPMKVGDVSMPLRSSSGFHLLKLDDKRGKAPALVKQVNARHILIRTNNKISDQEAKKQLDILRTRILDGGDFGHLASAFSADPGSAAKGGELGWNDPEIYVPEFKAMLNQLKINEISKPFKSAFGWHLVQLLGWREKDQTALLERNQAMNALREQKIDEAHQNWIRRIRDEAYVEIR